MKIAVVFYLKKIEIMRYECEISEEGDPKNGHCEALDAFRKEHPDVYLFSQDLMIGYEKA